MAGTWEQPQGLGAIHSEESARKWNLQPPIHKELDSVNNLNDLGGSEDPGPQMHCSVADPFISAQETLSSQAANMLLLTQGHCE